MRAHVLEASLTPLERAVREHPDSVSLTLDLARSLALSGKTDSARRVLQAAATRLPDRADVHLALGALSLNLQQYDDAVAAFSSALRLDPGNPALVHDLGIARLQLATQRLNAGDQSGARRALDEVLSTGIAPNRPGRASSSIRLDASPGTERQREKSRYHAVNDGGGPEQRTSERRPAVASQTK